MLGQTTLLLEIGVEELPASFVDGALAALPELTASRLAQARVAHGEVRALGTPRRLALLVHGVAARQADVDEDVVGPPEGAAYKDGQPTRAAEAFAQKLKVPLSSLRLVDKPAAGRQKAGKYVVGRRTEAGSPAREVLGPLLADLCAAIPFKKSMRWGAGTVAFGRPVHWIVALFGRDAIDMTFAGVRSGRTTRGHRFLAPQAFELETADEYVEALRKRHVIVDRKEREDSMMGKVAAAAKGAGGLHDTAAILVTENVSLVEEPHVVTGSFDPAFLALPAQVIRAVARGHQRYFSVEKADGALVPHYVAVVNTALDVPAIVKGNDDVMRARLSDARFFFEEDKKAKIEDRVQKLEGIVFHNALGTVRQKVSRIERLAVLVAEALGMRGDPLVEVSRAAHLAKFDLVSLMVGEFPELQGEMGRAYALAAGEAASVADAVRDHYLPAFATDQVAPSDVSASVALADRLDTLAGCFAAGLEPTGAADPYALRRACIAVLRTLLDKGGANPRYAKLDVLVLLDHARAGYEGKLAKDPIETREALARFALERLRGLIAQATSTPVADAVMADDGSSRTAVRHPVYVLARAKAVAAVVAAGETWLSTAKTVAKRLSGISKEAEAVLHPASALSKPDDAAIVKVVEDLDKVTRDLMTESAVTEALRATSELAKRVDDVFVRTLVNDPQDPKTKERLEVLSYGAACMLRIADFTRLG